MNKKSLNTVPLDGGAVVKKGAMVSELRNQKLREVNITKNGVHEITALKGYTGLDEARIAVDVFPVLSSGAGGVYKNGKYEFVPDDSTDGYSAFSLKGSVSPKAQEKTVEVTSEGQVIEVVNDAEYECMSSVRVNVNIPQYPYAGVKLEGEGFDVIFSAPNNCSWKELIDSYPGSPVINRLFNYVELFEDNEYIGDIAVGIIYRNDDNTLFDVRANGVAVSPSKYVQNAKLRKGDYFYVNKKGRVDSYSLDTYHGETVQELVNDDGSNIDFLYEGLACDSNRVDYFYVGHWPAMETYGRLLRADDLVKPYDYFILKEASKTQIMCKGVEWSDSLRYTSLKFPKGFSWKEYSDSEAVNLVTEGDEEYVEFVENTSHYRLTTDKEGVIFVRHDDIIRDDINYYGWFVNE